MQGSTTTTNIGSTASARQTKDHHDRVPANVAWSMTSVRQAWHTHAAFADAVQSVRCTSTRPVAKHVRAPLLVRETHSKKPPRPSAKKHTLYAYLLSQVKGANDDGLSAAEALPTRPPGPSVRKGPRAPLALLSPPSRERLEAESALNTQGVAQEQREGSTNALPGAAQPKTSAQQTDAAEGTEFENRTARHTTALERLWSKSSGPSTLWQILSKLIWEGHPDTARMLLLHSLFQHRHSLKFAEVSKMTLEAQEVEALLINMLHEVRHSESARKAPGPVSAGRRVVSKTLWMPPGSTRGISIEPHTQTLVAIRWLFHAAISVGLPTTSRMVMAVLRAYRNRPKNRAELVNATFNHVAGAGATTYDVCAPNFEFEASADLNPLAIPVQIVLPLLEALTRSAHFERGEEFLLWWAAARPSSTLPFEEPKRNTADLAPLTLPLVQTRYRKFTEPSSVPNFAWAHQGDIWAALIDGRTSVGDFRGASIWLHRYRVFLQQANLQIDQCSRGEIQARKGIAGEAPVTIRKQALPYEVFAKACCGRMTRRGNYDASEVDYNWIKVAAPLKRARVEAVKQVLQHARLDGVRFSPRTARFLIQFMAIAYPRSERLGMLVSQIAVDTATHREKTSDGPILAEWFGPLCRLQDHNIFPRGGDVALSKEVLQDQALAESAKLIVDIMQSPRNLLAYMLLAHHRQTRGAPSKASAWVTTQNLESIVRSCLIAKDTPAAIIALRTHRICNRATSFELQRTILKIAEKEAGLPALKEIYRIFFSAKDSQTEGETLGFTVPYSFLGHDSSPLRMLEHCLRLVLVTQVQLAQRLLDPSNHSLQITQSQIDPSRYDTLGRRGRYGSRHRPVCPAWAFATARSLISSANAERPEDREMIRLAMSAANKQVVKPLKGASTARKRRSTDAQNGVFVDLD
ncbi:hypothetical protein IE81DRAFT_324544 [Ceraceosorus guamensis]|uniref:Uncharacterized protein n=1 Tax=Ceraceosorus guamensis TaxID=1522189 RepID=A0A316VUV7_9BASI|nr:hypothetical protein IE81DRAFT_324544 [Ceraceosorus guamensis]PWN41406.1 hypothetical protein IE81DRAFT_324544 [Ceraceosorus guamensis]